MNSLDFEVERSKVKVTIRPVMVKKVRQTHRRLPIELYLVCVFSLEFGCQYQCN